jgi:hypothetical protein
VIRGRNQSVTCIIQTTGKFLNILYVIFCPGRVVRGAREGRVWGASILNWLVISSNRRFQCILQTHLQRRGHRMKDSWKISLSLVQRAAG